MKRALLVILAAAAAACSTLKTGADYDPSTDFSKYKTWDLKVDNSINNPLIAKRIESAVTAELSKKGMTRNPSNPDVWVAVHARLSKQTQVNTYDSGWGYGYGWRYGGGMSTTTVTEVPVGTLIVDIVDAGKKELVWRGTASDTLNPEASPEKKEQNLQEAMAKLLAAYPPAKKG
jgi:uncharacterized protein DUF4136